MFEVMFAAWYTDSGAHRALFGFRVPLSYHHQQVTNPNRFKVQGYGPFIILVMYLAYRKANWGPACRVVVEDISEWFAIFFLLYRCVFGFALLNQGSV